MSKAKVSWLLCIGRLVSKNRQCHALCTLGKTSKCWLGLRPIWVVSHFLWCSESWCYITMCRGDKANNASSIVTGSPAGPVSCFCPITAHCRDYQVQMLAPVLPFISCLSNGLVPYLPIAGCTSYQGVHACPTKTIKGEVHPFWGSLLVTLDWGTPCTTMLFVRSSTSAQLELC